MKKIICLILSLVFVLCSVSYTPLAANVDDELSEALILFNAMGLVEDNDDMHNTLTRADFAFRLAQFMNIDVNNDSGVNYFSDIPDIMWSKAAINALAERKFIVGSNGLFMPDKNISGMEAVKLMLMLAGYDAEAEARGGWPNGYLLAASRLKLTKDITLGDTITAGDFYKLLYRTAQVNYMMPDGMENNNVVYSADDSDTVLEFYHDIHYTEGRVTAVGASALSSGRGCKSDEVILDDKIYKNPGESIDFYQYLGHEVKMFYHSVKENNKTAVCVISAGNTNKSTTIYSEDLANIVDNGRYYTVVYYQNNKEKEVRIDRGAVVLKNGVGVTDGVYQALNITHGYMNLISYDGDSTCDVVRINDGFDMVIGNINNENSDVTIDIHTSGQWYMMRGEVGDRVILYDKYDSTLMTDISPSIGRVIRLKNANGDSIDYDDLSVGDVVTVFKSDDDSHVEVIKGLGTVVGTIMDFSSSPAKITIDGKSYELTDAFMTNHSNEIKSGVKATFVLNPFGRIAYMVADQSNTALAYLYDMSYITKGMTESLQIKLFSLDTKTLILDVPQKVNINGVTVKGYANIVNKISKDGVTVEPQVVRFSMNSSGALSYLDLPGPDTDESEDTLIKSGEGTGLYYSSAQEISTVPTCVFNSSKTKILVVPTDSAIKSGQYEDDWFAVKKLTDISHGNSYSMTMYRVGVHSDYEDVLVIKKDNEWGSAAATIPMLIEKISRGIDENGEVVDVVTAYTTAQNSSKYFISDLSVLAGKGIEAGDYVWFMLDVNGRITDVKKILYKANGGKQFTGDSTGYSGTNQADIATSTSIGATMFVESAYATELSGNVLRYGYEIGDINGACNLPTSIYVVDTSLKTPQVRFASKTEIADYLRAGDSCSKLIIYSNSYRVRQVVIYR